MKRKYYLHILCEKKMVQVFSKTKRSRHFMTKHVIRVIFLLVLVLALFSLYIDPVSIQVDESSSELFAQAYQVGKEPKDSKATSRQSPPQSNPNFERFRKYPSARGRGPVQRQPQSDPLDPFLTSGNGWDVSPIVIERYRLVFFTIPKTGTTVFKQLFRRMMGFGDWTNDKDPNLPHNPQFNGLQYLYAYPYDKVLEFMNSPNWTRAVFVRDPKDRMLSAFLDKGLNENATYIKRKCCGIKPKREEDDLSFKQWQLEHQKRIEMQLQSPSNANQQRRSSSSNWFLTHGLKGGRRRLREIGVSHIQSRAMASQGMSVGKARSVPAGSEPPSYCANLTSPAATLDFETFVQQFLTRCNDPHWMPQSHRMDESLWKHVNFVGHFDRLAEDTKRLLESIGAWGKYGASGWPHGGFIFAENSARHKTAAHEKLEKYYTPRLEQIVYDFYKDDYENPTLNISKASHFVGV
jgi:hypothetical protein